MNWDMLGWLVLGLTLEKLLDYVVWPTWKRKRAPKKLPRQLIILRTPKQPPK